MGLFTKLRKKRHNKKGEKKHEEYESEDVASKAYSKTRAAPELVVGDAPTRPKFGGKGLKSNTTYTYEGSDDGTEEMQEHEKRTAGGKNELHEFGVPPGTATAADKASVDSPATTSSGQNAARAAIDDVADGHKPGESDESKVKAADLGSGNAPMDDAQSDPVVPAIGERPEVAVNVVEVLKIALAVYLAFIALFTAWLRPTASSLITGLLIGLAFGLGYAWLFYAARYKKLLLNEGFNIQPGRKGMIELLGSVPSWISFQERERVTWANLMMSQMWQYYDRAIGQAIKESVEPIMDQYKPPGLVKKIYFKRITFGDLPITIDDVWIENEGEKHILVEMAFRLNGNSNIEIAVELVGGAARVVPKVTDLHVSGVARVILSPLLPEIPGFGAMVFSLKRPPLIHFNLSFGSALGGGASASLVRTWLDPFLRDTLTSLVVWPNRIVFPILPESPANNLEDLGIKNMGVIEVTVVEARELDKEDWLGKSDPLVEVWTQHEHIESTKHKRKTLNPEWHETFHLLVQEPKTQAVRLQVYDWDGVHLKEVLSNINIVKGVKDSFGAKTFMGRVAIPVRPYYDKPGQSVTEWFDLGKQEWFHEDGTGKGHGAIHLELTYWPFDMIYSEPREATIGAVLITLKSAKDLPAADSNGLSDPYAVLTLAGRTKRSMIIYDTLSPEWNEKFEFIKVSPKEILEVELWDDDPLDPDDKLGIVEIDIARDVIPAARCTIEKIFYLKDVPKDAISKEQKKASVRLKIQWVPFDFHDQHNENGEGKSHHLPRLHLHKDKDKGNSEAVRTPGTQFSPGASPGQVQ